MLDIENSGPKLKYLFVNESNEGIETVFEHSERLSRIASKITQAVMRYTVRKVHVTGVENLAELPAGIIVSNHRSMTDIPLATTLTDKASFNQMPRFVAKESLWKFLPYGRLLETLGVTPVAQSGNYLNHENESLPRQSLGSLRKMARSVIKSIESDNRNVVIYPQGHMYKSSVYIEENQIENGASMIARRLKSPIKPFGIYFSSQPSVYRPLSTIVGISVAEPFYPSLSNAGTTAHIREVVNQHIGYAKELIS